jgi:hypothetical protein
MSVLTFFVDSLQSDWVALTKGGRGGVPLALLVAFGVLTFHPISGFKARNYALEGSTEVMIFRGQIFRIFLFRGLFRGHNTSIGKIG